ncbi:MAG: hypothetical protein R3C53_21385 [Pirellulaceae bacterium]
MTDAPHVPTTVISPVERWARIGADCLQLLSVGLLLEFLLFTGTEVDARVRVIVIAVLLAGVARAQGWLVLISLQMCLILSESRSRELELSLAAYLYCLIAIAVVAYAFSARRTGHRVSRWMAAVIMQLVGQPSSSPATGSHLTHDRMGQSTGRKLAINFSSWSRVLVQFIVFNGVVVFAAIVLGFLPIRSQANQQWFDASLANSSILWPGPSVLIVACLLYLVIREFHWRHMTPAQARLWLRSGYMQFHHRDLMLILRKRIRARRANRTAKTP